MHQFKITGNNEGFSIIETMIAIVIFSIGILGIFSMQVHALKTGVTSKQVSNGTTMCTSLLDSLSALPFNHADLSTASTHAPTSDSDYIDNDNDGQIDETGETGHYTASWNVTANDVVQNTLTITATISWTNGQTPKTIAMTGVKPLVL